MKRLRHPIRAIREPFGTAGLIVACVALIAALGGTALAAKGALTGKQKKEVEKIAKKFAGKPGANGAPGAQGPAGPAGKDGTNGTNGTNGTDGAPGARGPEGSPWTAGGVLPTGKTETGSWAVNAPPEQAVSAISFSIQLTGSLGASQVHYVNENGEEAVENGGTIELVPQPECPGTPAEPEAEAGNLCVYQAFVNGTNEVGGLATGVRIYRADSNPLPLGAAKSGAVMTIPSKEEGGVPQTVFANGTWAVTAP